MPDDAHRLRLRALRTSDEESFAATHRELAAEGTGTGSAYRADMGWNDFLRLTSDYALGRNLPEGWVTNTFLVADIDGTMVGFLSLRHSLTPALSQYGGHIGYAVLPAYRRRGYATEMLSKGLDIAHAVGISPVLITCDETNVASIKVIEANAGRFSARVQVPGRNVETRHYWIG